MLAPLLSFVLGFIFCLAFMGLVIYLAIRQFGSGGGAIFRVEVVNSGGAIVAREHAAHDDYPRDDSRYRRSEREYDEHSGERGIDLSVYNPDDIEFRPSEPQREPGVAVYAEDLGLPLPLLDGGLTFAEKCRQEEEQRQRQEQAMLLNLFEQNVKLRQSLSEPQAAAA